MATELSFVSIEWIKPLWKKLNKIWDQRDQEIMEIGNVFGDPRLLAKYYVEPNCQHYNPADFDEDDGPRSWVKSPIFTTINDFLGKSTPLSDGRNQLFILADAGMGKTSLLVMLKLSQLLNFWPKGYDCLLLKLGSDTLQRITDHKSKPETVLLLDALDEDTEAHERIAERLEELLEISLNFRHVIITCRTQFFPKTDLDPFGRPGRVTVGTYTCPMLFVSLFDDRQVREYLLRRFPNPWHHGLTKRQDHRVIKAERLLDPMRSLKFRPLLLAHIEDLLDAELRTWDSYHIYEALVTAWLKREIRKMKDQHLPRIPAEQELWDACRVLAVYLQSLGQRLLPEAELGQLIQRMPEVRNIKLVDFGGRSLLNRNSDSDYRFAHYSIQEFLVINALLTDTLAQDLTYCTTEEQPKPRATAQMLEFLHVSGSMGKSIGHFFSHFDCSDIRWTALPFKNELENGDEGPEMMLIPAGEFLMGSSDNGSAHTVKINKPFALGRYPVTFAEFDRFCHATGRQPPDDQRWGRGRWPVINVSWDDAREYCEWLSALTGARFRKPTEAEWEYAARAGTTSDYYWEGQGDTKDFAWFSENAENKTHPVGELKPNAFGLQDMSGNVWEWVQDCWHENYDQAPGDGSAWLAHNNGDCSRRVLCGGSWHYGQDGLRSAFRYGLSPVGRYNDVGFRLAQD
ncbi:MAG: formylglycine-generating enzyme family protein [Methylococcaceae bacterium]